MNALQALAEIETATWEALNGIDGYHDALEHIVAIAQKALETETEDK